MNYNLSETHINALLIAPGERADVLFTCNQLGTHSITTSNNTDMDHVLFSVIVVNNNSVMPEPQQIALTETTILDKSIKHQYDYSLADELGTRRKLLGVFDAPNYDECEEIIIYGINYPYVNNMTAEKYENMTLNQSKCARNTQNTILLKIDYCTGWMNETELNDYLLAMHVMDTLGFAMNNNFVLTSLLCVSCLTVTFVMVGVNLTVKDKTITSILALTQLILLTSFITIDVTFFSNCFVDGFLEGLIYNPSGRGGAYVPSLFHYVDFTLCAMVCTVWTHYCVAPRSKTLTCVVFASAFAIPVFWFLIDDQIAVYFFNLGSYHLFQFLVALSLTTIHFQNVDLHLDSKKRKVAAFTCFVLLSLCHLFG